MSKTYTEEEVREIVANTERHMAESLALSLGHRMQVPEDWGELLREVRSRCNGPPEDQNPASWRVYAALRTLDRDWDELTPNHEDMARNILRVFAHRIRKSPAAEGDGE